MIISKKPPYANTDVDPDKTQMEIDKLLQSYGVQGIQWTKRYDLNQVELSFIIETEIEGVKKQIGIKVTPPLFLAKRKTYDKKFGKYVIIEAPNFAQSFRLLYYWLKTKLESVAYGMFPIEQEFLSQVMVMLPNGQRTTMGMYVTTSFNQGQLQIEAPKV